jgi:hypothetical protein
MLKAYAIAQPLSSIFSWTILCDKAIFHAKVPIEKCRSLYLNRNRCLRAGSQRPPRPSSMLLVKGEEIIPRQLAFLFAKLFLWAMPKKKRKVVPVGWPVKSGVYIPSSSDVLIYSRTGPAEGWIHGGSAAFTVTNTLTFWVGFINAARRQLRPETRWA